MGRRNIYVPEGREGVYDEAALMAGSLSAAIDSALEMYVRSVRAGWLRMELFEVPLGRNEQRRQVTFRARLLGEYRLDEHQPGRIEGVQLYQGTQGRVAGWHWSDPDWSHAHSGPTAYLAGGGFGDDWFERWGLELVVRDTWEVAADRFGLAEEEREELRRNTTPRVVQEIEF